MRLLRTAALVLCIAGASCTSDRSDEPRAPVTSAPAITPAPTAPSTPVPTEEPPVTTGFDPTPDPSAPVDTPEDSHLFELASDDPVVARSDAVRSARFVAPGAVVVRDGLFHMLSGGFERWPGESNVAYYTSLDGRNWAAGSPAPVLTSAEVGIADPGTMGHTVVQDSKGLWVMYFHTFSGDDEPGVIGRVTAPTPLGPWTADPEPVLEPGPPGSWDSLRLSRPQVVDAGDELLMYYSGVDADGHEQIGLATSQDGRTWVKFDDPSTVEARLADSDPVLTPTEDWEGPNLLRPSVTLSPDGYVMLYQNGRDYGLAFSDDGRSWTRYDDNPVVTADQTPGWAFRLFQGALLYDDDTYFFYLEAGNEQGADVFLLTHEGPLRDLNDIGGTVVETLVPSLDISTGGVAVDSEGNVYVADFGSGSEGGTELYRIDRQGEVTVFADDPLLVGASGNTVGPDGTVYQSSFSGGRVMRISPDGEVELLADEGISGPVGVVVDPSGTGLFVADCGANAIVHVDFAGEVTPFAADPLFSCPNGLTTDGKGTLFVANFSNGAVLAVDDQGAVDPVAVVPGDNNGHIAYYEGDLYVVARGIHSIYKVTLDGEMSRIVGTGERGLRDGFALRATLSLPNGIAIDAKGVMFVNHVVAIAGSANSPTTVRLIRIR